MYALPGYSHGIGTGGVRRQYRSTAVPRTGLARHSTTPYVVTHGIEHARQRDVGMRFKEEQAPAGEPVADPARALLPTAVPSGHRVVTFELHKHCQYGDVWAICGSAPGLGEWDATKALPMKWTPGDKWLAAVALPENSKLEFKVVVLDSKNANKVKGWANDVTKDNIVLDMAQHNTAAHGCCSVQVLVPAAATGARPPTTTTGLQPGMTVPAGSASTYPGAAASGAAETPVPSEAAAAQSTPAHGEPAPQHHGGGAVAALEEKVKASAHKMAHAVEELKGSQPTGAEPVTAQAGGAGASGEGGAGGALHMPHIAAERRDLTPQEVEKSRAAAGVRVFEAGGHAPEASPSVTVDRVVPPGSTVSSTANLASEPTGPEVTAWPAAAPISSVKPPMTPSTATTPTPISSTSVVSEQYSSGSASAPAAAATGAISGTSAFSPAETADISSSVAGMSTPTTGAAASPVELTGTGSSLSGMATPAAGTAGGAAAPTEAEESISTKISKGIKNAAGKLGRKQQQGKDKPKAAAEASHMLAEEAALETPVSEEMYTAASVLDNIGGGDEELPMAPLASGVTPVTGPSAASGGPVLNPKKNPIVMAASTLLSKMSDLLSGSTDSVRTVDVPEDYEAAMECGSVNAEGAAVSKTAASAMYNPNLGGGFVYPSAALFARAAAEADRGAGMGDNVGAAPESGAQRGERAGNEPSGTPAGSNTEAAPERGTREPVPAEPTTPARRASSPSASDIEAASAPESGTRDA